MFTRVTHFCVRMPRPQPGPSVRDWKVTASISLIPSGLYPLPLHTSIRIIITSYFFLWNLFAVKFLSQPRCNQARARSSMSLYSFTVLLTTTYWDRPGAMHAIRYWRRKVNETQASLEGGWWQHPVTGPLKEVPAGCRQVQGDQGTPSGGVLLGPPPHHAKEPLHQPVNDIPPIGMGTVMNNSRLSAGI